MMSMSGHTSSPWYQKLSPTLATKPRSRASSSEYPAIALANFEDPEPPQRTPIRFAKMLNYLKRSRAGFLAIILAGTSFAEYGYPRTMATGTLSSLFMQSSAADANSSATQITVAFRLYPYWSVLPR